MTFIKSILRPVFKALVITPLFVSYLAFSCGGNERFLSPSTFIGPRDFHSLLKVYLTHEPQGADALTHKAYLTHLKALAAQKGVNLKEDLFEDPISYFGPFESNTYESALAFMDAAAQDVDDPVALGHLMERRHMILSHFMDTGRLATLKTLLGKDLGPEAAPFAAYLQGAFAFYTGEPRNAYTAFQRASEPVHQSFWKNILSSFGHKPSDWLAQSALYMQGRTMLVASQEKMEDCLDADSRAKINQNDLKIARLPFESYLKTYPQGLYKDSVKGLLRRIDYLENNQKAYSEKLRMHINNLCAKDPLSTALTAPLEEYVNHFKEMMAPNTDAPLMIAAHVMHAIDTLEMPLLKETLMALDKRAPDFAPYPGLALFLKAVVLTHMKNHQDVARLPLETPLNIVQQGTQVLRAQAQITLKELPQALHTLHVLKQSLNMDLDNDHVDVLLLRAHILLKSTPSVILKDITSAQVKELYLERTCPTQDLKDLSQTQDLDEDVMEKVRTALKRRLLLEGAFTEILSTNLLKEDDAHFVRTFLQNKSSASHLFDMGEWLSENTRPWDGNGPEFAHELQEVCPECTQVPLTLVPPLDYYMTSLSAPIGKKDDHTHAYALGALSSQCFHGNSQAFSCLWEHSWEKNPRLKKIHDVEVPKWFYILKTRYKHTDIAKETRYYH